MIIRNSFGKVVGNRERMNGVQMRSHVFRGDWWKPCLVCTLPELHPVHNDSFRKEVDDVPV